MNGNLWILQHSWELSLYELLLATPFTLARPAERQAGRLFMPLTKWPRGLLEISLVVFYLFICFPTVSTNKQYRNNYFILSPTCSHFSIFPLFFLGTCRVCLSGTGREAYIDLRPYGLMARSDSSVWASQIGRLAIGHTHTWQMGSVLRFAVTHKFDWTGGSLWLWQFVWKRND